MPYHIKEVAAISGLTVRMLRYYDKIGLLCPQRKENGYRIYGDAELLRLQQILFFKELGFSLAEIKGFLNRRDFDRGAAFQAQKQLLLLEITRLQRMIRNIDLCLLEMEKGGKIMEDKERFAVLSKAEIEAAQAQYREEAAARYGKEALAVTERKTKEYDDAKWADIQRRSKTILQALAQRLDLPPEDAETQALIGAYRQEISDNYYDCTLEIYQGLGALYVADERFTAYFDNFRPGLARFMQAAIDVYCQSQR